MNDNYEYDPHSSYRARAIPWAICKKCGLVYLHNKLTEWAIEKGCNYADHPSYKHKISKLVKKYE